MSDTISTSDMAALCRAANAISSALLDAFEAAGPIAFVCGEETKRPGQPWFAFVCSDDGEKENAGPFVLIMPTQDTDCEANTFGSIKADVGEVENLVAVIGRTIENGVPVRVYMKVDGLADLGGCVVQQGNFDGFASVAAQNHVRWRRVPFHVAMLHAATSS